LGAKPPKPTSLFGDIILVVFQNDIIVLEVVYRRG